MKQIKKHVLWRRVMAFVLCLCMVSSMVSGIGLYRAFASAAGGTAAAPVNGPTSGATRQADPSTMDTYQQMLNFSENTRYAGRLWSDKSVFALGYGDAGNRSGQWIAGDDETPGVLSLTKALDGVEGSVKLDEDFLHVFSALGSSLKLDDSIKGPYDVVILLDMSGSMAAIVDKTKNDRETGSRIAVVLDSVNKAIDELMGMHETNRVAVIVYGATAYTLMELGHYKPTGKNTDGEDVYLSVSNFTDYNNNNEADLGSKASGAYTISVSADKESILGEESSYESYVRQSVRNDYAAGKKVKGNPKLIGFHTDLQAGIWQGFNELYNNLDPDHPETYSYTYESKLTGEKTTIPRIPVAFVMTDGGSNLALGNASAVTGDEWHNLTIPDSVSGGASWYGTASNRKYRSENAGYHGSGVILDILLTASYMKSKIINRYKELQKNIKDSPENAARMVSWDFSIHTFSVDTPTTDWQIPRVYAALDPKEYFNADPPALPKNATWKQKEDVTNAFSSWQEWIKVSEKPGKSIQAEVDTGEYGGTNWKFKINTLSEEQQKTEGVTNQDVIDNINYNDSFRDITGTDLSDYFEELIGQLGQELFSPVGGENDLGVDNAVTYMDPIGKYMDVKDVTNLSLFGELYDIVKTAVYDYQWNHQYMKNLGQENEPLEEGWYKGDPTASGNDGVTKYDSSSGGGYYPDNCKTIDEAWAAGWVYRVNYQTASQYVPTLENINEGTEPDAAKQQNTVYTFYRIAGTSDGDPMTDDYLTKLHMNPAYGDAVPASAHPYDEAEQKHLETPGVYALIDIRIWTEDSGDYTDDTPGDTLTDTNYDEALWVNIPVNMLPLRRVTVKAGDGIDDITYSTNIPANTNELTAAQTASFPLRLFYTVGVSDEVLEASNRVNIAGAISAEYIKENKVTSQAAETVRNVPQGNLEFFSNWYNPLNRYSDYATTSTDYTFGDPVVSFSPSTDNRYYAFEKDLPLYGAAYRYDGESWKRVKVEGDTLTESLKDNVYGTSATGFGGRLIAQDLEANNADEIGAKLSEKSITPQEDDIVFLKKDRLTDVTRPADGSGQPDPFPSDGYYFLAIEFFNLTAGTTGSAEGTEEDPPEGTAAHTQYAITRRGSEFGSGYGSAGIKNGDMLVWHDMSGKNEDQPYKSFTEGQDPDRGKPDSDGEWVLCAKKGGLRVGALAQSVQGKGGAYTEMEKTTMVEFSAQRYPGNHDADGLTWGYYDNNVTRTANNYYMPTISTASSLGENNDIIVNVYLGNNGRLYVSDTTLLVTKTVEPAEGMTFDKNKEFNFQVFIANADKNMSAIVVHLNENTKSWQRQFHTIDLELDGQLFLQTQDGAKAMVDSTGLQVVSSGDGYVYADSTKGVYSTENGGPYYVYIGKNRTTAEVGASSTGFRVYHNSDVDTAGEVSTKDVKIETGEDGKTKYSAATVWLVPVSTFDTAWAGKDPIGDTEFNIEGGGTSDKLYTTKLENFELLTLDPTAAGTEVTVSSPYRTASTYWTKELTFGVNSNPDGDNKNADHQALTADDLYDQIIPAADRPDYFTGLTNETIARNTAEFTLKHGEGLLFSGISSNSVYRVTEKLTKEDMEAGYTLKQVSHNQQYGSLSTYRPGAQEIPVYYKDGTTYGWYGDGAYPSQYADYKTEKGLMWALDKDGKANTEVEPKYEPFHHTNAVVWESYSTMDKGARGDNHHQPAGVTPGTSTFWLWNESTKTSENTQVTHTVGDNPSCKPLENGGCDEDIADTNQVRHYFFKDGELRDVHYQGEGSGFIRNIGRYITSPTVHFAVEGESEAYAKKAMTEFEQSTDYTGAYSVFGNTGTYEESANFVNTVEPGTISVTKDLEPDGELTDEDKTKPFDFTLTLTKPAPDTGISGPKEGYPYTIKDASGVVKTGKLVPSDATSVGENDIKAEPDGTWKFQLQGGQALTVEKIPGKTGYTVTEAGAKGFKTNVQVNGGAAATGSTTSGTIAPGEAKKTEILFTNIKDIPALLSLVKTLTVKLHGGAQFNETLEFTVEPSKDNDAASDPIQKRDGFADGKLTLTMPFDVTTDGAHEKTLTIFDNDAFTQEGTYTYTIKETDTAIPGMKYDDKVYTATVVVSKDASAAAGEQDQLKAVLTLKLKDENVKDVVEFANDYDVARIAETFTVTKELEDTAGNKVTLKGGEFSFTLEAKDCTYSDAVGGTETFSPMPEGAKDGKLTVTNDKDGNVLFGEVEFTRPGTYNYTIKEVKPASDAPFTYGYDETVYNVTVKVTQETDKSLKSTVTYEKTNAPGESVTSAAFKNTVELGGLTVKKTVEGDSGETTRDFNFTVTFTDKDDQKPTDDGWKKYVRIDPESGTTWNDNVLSFTLKHGESLTVTGLPVGMKYTVQENPPADRHYNVEYKNQNGTIAENTNVQVSVKNIAPNVSPLHIRLVKKLTLQPGSAGVDVHGVFTFTVTPASSNPADDPLRGEGVRTLTTADIAVGKTGELEIFSETDEFRTLGKEYVYTVKEERGNIPGVNYDSKIYTVTVKVEAQYDADKHLYILIPHVTVTDSMGNVQVNTELGASTVLDFENTYSAYEITAAIEAQKSFKDGVLREGQFEFELTAKDDATPMPEGAKDGKITASNTAGGFVSFGNIKYTEPGTYTYTLKELSGTDKSVDYDGTEYEVVVTVARDPASGALTAKVTYDGKDKAEFTNTQKTGSLTVSKTVAGAGGETGRAFEFTVTFTDKNGNTPEDDAWRRYVQVVVGASYPGTLSWTGTYSWSANKLVFTLTHGESLTVTGIPAGMKYEVTETSVDGYRTDVTAGGKTENRKNTASGAIPVNGTASVEVTFTNTKDTPALLSLEKTLNMKVHGGAAFTGEFKFTVTPEGNDADTDPIRTHEGFENGVLTLTIPFDTKSADTITKTIAIFDDDAFTHEGTYTYTIRELTSGIPGMSYDNRVYTATVKVTKITGTGTDPDRFEAALTLTLDGKEVDKLAFKNDYVAARTELTLTAQKTLVDSDDREQTLEDGEFSFTLTAGKCDYSDTLGGSGTSPMPAGGEGGTLTKANDAKGGVSFGGIEFTRPGTYHYTVEEVAGSDSHIVYDGTKYEVLVTVTRAATGELTASATYSGGKSQAEFTNTLKTGSLTVTKTVTGEGGEMNRAFGFTVTFTNTPAGEAWKRYVRVTQNAGNVDYAWDGNALTFTLKNGESLTVEGLLAGIGYTVREEDLKGEHYTTNYAPAGSDSGDIQEGVEKRVTVTNFRPAPGSTEIFLQVEKNLLFSGDAGPDVHGAFTFTVTPDVNNPASDPLQGKARTLTTGDLHVGESDVLEFFRDDDRFTEAGTYIYTVQEVPGQIPGVSYDSRVYTVTVEITSGVDETNWKYVLTSTVTVEDSQGGVVTQTNPAAPVVLRFDNSYSAHEITAAIEAHKTLVDGSLRAGRFQFELIAGTDEQGNPSPMPEGAADQVTAWNLAGGIVTFGDITYREPGVYKYTLREVPGSDSSVVYDEKTYTVVVTVERPNGGPLTAKVTYLYNDGEKSGAEFTNTQLTGGLTVKKTVTGEGDKGRSFRFTVTFVPSVDLGGVTATKYDAENRPVADISIDENGVLAFSLKDGERVEVRGLPANTAYTVTETDANADGYTTQMRDADGELTDGTGVIRADTQDEVKVYNDLRTPKGGFTVEKEVTGDGGEKDRAFAFTVTIKDEDGNTPKDEAWKKYVKVTHSAGRAAAWKKNVLSFTLKHGETLTVDGLPAGMKYSVREEDLTGKHYTTVFDPAPAEGTVTDGGMDTVTVTNDRPAPTSTQVLLQVVKNLLFSGNADPNIHGVFTFTVTPDANNPASDPLQGKARTLTTGDLHVGESDVLKFFGDDDRFTAEGKYVYTVQEIPGQIPGVSYDSRVYTVTVVITSDVDETSWEYVLTPTVTVKDSDGHVVTQTDPKSPMALEFTNTYSAYEIAASIEAKKILRGGVLREGQFRFELTAGVDGNGNPSPMPNPSGSAITKTNDADGNVSFGSITYREPGVYKYTLREVPGSDTTVDYDGTVYTVLVTVTRTATGELAASVTYNGGDRAEFTNAQLTGGLTVEKSVTGLGNRDKDFHFTVTFTPDAGLDGAIITKNGSPLEAEIVNGVLEFTLKHGERVEITGLPAGTDYRVAEDDYTSQGYTTTPSNASGVIPAGGIAHAEFVNDRVESKNPETGNLTVSKTVIGEGDLNKEFHFTVTLGGTSADGIRGGEITGQFGDLYFTNGVAEFTLKHGQSVTATDLPAGITYVVAEDDYTQEDYVTTVHGEPEGIIPKGGTAEAGFINDFGKVQEPMVRCLEVTKTVMGQAGDLDRNFHFTVTLYKADGTVDTSVDGVYGDMRFKKGVAEFTLKSGQSALATDLPKDDSYTVVETEADKDGYDTTVTGGTGIITDTGTANADFINRKDPPPEEKTGDLTVKKTVTGDAGDPEKVFHFTVTLSGVADDGTRASDITGTFGGMTFKNGVAEFTLKDSQSKTASGLPVGLGYTVTEAEADKDGYHTSSSGTEGTVPDGAAARADFVNSASDKPGPGLGNLTVTKLVSGTAGDKSKEWSFRVELSDKSVNGTYGGMTFTDGVAEFTLKSGESATATGLPAGITYTVTEKEANADGYDTTSTGASGTIPENGTANADFVNSKDDTTTTPKKGGLTVSKTVTAGDAEKEWHFTVTLSDKTVDGIYGEMLFVNGVAEFTLKSGESLTATGLPAGITYEVAEFEANKDGYTTTATGASGTIPADGEAEARFVNHKDTTTTPKTGSLTVKKTVTGTAGDKSKEWNFRVELSDKSVSGTYGGMTFRNGVAAFKLKHGEEKTATGLPAGVTYTVTETEANEDGYITTPSGESGTIPENDTARAEFTNYKDDHTEEPDSGSLTVTKTVTGTAGDPEKVFHFTVTLSDTSVNGAYGEMTFKNGVAEFTLKSGETITATGLPAGIDYTVTEQEADRDGYTTSSTGGKGAIEEGETAKAEFVNHKDTTTTPETGGLTVKKTVTGTAGDTAKAWHFTVKLSDTSVNGIYGGMFFANGVAEFTLKSGDSLTAEGLPAGVTYTVTEFEANADGYDTTSTGASGTIPANGKAEAKFTNNKDEKDDTLKTGNLTVSKTVTGTAGDKSKEWHFRVELSDKSVNGTYGGMTFVNGVAEFTLKHGESLTAEGLPAGITYTVTEAEANADGYTTGSTGSAGTIPADGTAEAKFTNSKDDTTTPKTGGLTVSKTVTGNAGDKNKEFNFRVELSDKTVNGTFGGMTFVNGVAEFTLKHGESLTAEGLPAGIAYTVTETEANADGYHTTIAGDEGTIPDGGAARADFVNSKNTETEPGKGNLTVTKLVSGTAGDTGKVWHFTVTLSDATISGTYGGMTFTNGVAEFTLKSGESATATGLPTGITYTVTEKEANADGYDTTSTGASGEIPENGTANADFVNSKDAPEPELGGLTVSKTVTGTAGDTDRDWHFTVTLSDKTVNGIYGEMFFVNGVAEFTLKSGESLTAEGLPVEITYTVTEFEADKDGYTTTATGASGTIPADGEAEAKFVNHKDTTTTPETGSLTVKKTVTGMAGDKSKEWNFRVELSDKSVSGTYGGMTFTDGVATFTLKHGESMTAEGLPAGITYTVTEAEANADGYTTGSTGSTGTIPANGEAEAKFTNHKDTTTTPKTGSLTVKKTVTGTAGDKSKEWNFRVELSDRTVSGTYGGMTFRNGVASFKLRHGEEKTATGLPAGVTYTVTETEANEDGYVTTPSGESGTIPENDTARAEFTNYKDDHTEEPDSGSLTVTKTVTAGDLEKEWHFTVTLSDTTVNGAFGEMTFKNGVAEFTLKSGETITATGLPAGVTYTVTETEANADGYDTTSTGASGTIPANGKAEAKFVNHNDTTTTPETGSLTVKKTVTGTAGDTSKEWNFRVELSDKSVNGIYGEMTFRNGVAEFTLKHGESLTAEGLPAGLEYTVTETEANEDGYTTGSTGSTGTIPENGTANADFVNHKDDTTTTPKKGDLTVSKTVTGGAEADGDLQFHFTVTLSGSAADGTSAADINGRYGDMFFTHGVAQFDLKDGERRTASGLPAGLDYTVTETPTAGFTPIEPQGGGTGGIIPGNGTAEADFVNRKDTVTKRDPESGSLTVTKTVTGDAGEADREWHFRVELSDTSVNGQYGDMTFVNGVAEFTLKHGESAYAPGLPTGVTYTVTEEEANEDGYTTSVVGDKGTISKDAAARANFINRKDPPPETVGGDLVVTKTVTGSAGDVNREFHFIVTLGGSAADGTSAADITGTYGGMTFVNGVAEFTLRHGQSKTAKGLPAGLTYTVRETEADQNGYHTFAAGESGTVPGGGTARADFVNSKDMEPGPEPKTGNLTVTKMVSGNGGEMDREWHFTVTLSDATVNGTYGDMTFVNGVAEFTLKHGQSKTAKGLPAGIKYTVTETEANQDGYHTDSTGAKGSIPDGDTACADFVNAMDPGLTVEKMVINPTEEDLSKNWHFAVKLEPPAGNPINWDALVWEHSGGRPVEIDRANNTLRFVLRHGESVRFGNIPQNTHYMVTETEANVDPFRTTVDPTFSPAEGLITLDPEVWVRFLNERSDLPDEPTPGNGGLRVEKHVSGATGEAEREWHFRVELSRPLTGWYGNMTFVNGVAEFTLKDGESLTAAGLPAGVTYTVTEAEADQDGYTTEASGQIGTVPDGGTAEACFINSRGETPPTEPDNPPEIPKTGDDSHLGLWTALMILSLTGVAATSFSLFGRQSFAGPGKWRVTSFKGKHRRK